MVFMSSYLFSKRFSDFLQFHHHLFNAFYGRILNNLFAYLELKNNIYSETASDDKIILVTRSDIADFSSLPMREAPVRRYHLYQLKGIHSHRLHMYQFLMILIS